MRMNLELGPHHVNELEIHVIEQPDQIADDSNHHPILYPLPSNVLVLRALLVVVIVVTVATY